MTRNQGILLTLLLVAVVVLGFNRMSALGPVSKTPIVAPLVDEPLATHPGKESPSSPEAASGAPRPSSSASRASPTPRPATPAAPANTATYDQVTTETTGHAESVAGHLRPVEDHLRHTPAHLLLGRARSHPAQPPGPGRRHQLPLGHLLRERAAAQDRAGSTSSNSTPRMPSRQDRHRSDPSQSLLQGRGLPPGLRHQEPQQPLHPDLRRAQRR
jgi:hypothetical protein